MRDRGTFQRCVNTSRAASWARCGSLREAGNESRGEASSPRRDTRTRHGHVHGNARVDRGRSFTRVQRPPYSMNTPSAPTIGGPRARACVHEAHGELRGARPHREPLLLTHRVVLNADIIHRSRSGPSSSSSCVPRPIGPCSLAVNGFPSVPRHSLAFAILSSVTCALWFGGWFFFFFLR